MKKYIVANTQFATILPLRMIHRKSKIDIALTYREKRCILNFSGFIYEQFQCAGEMT